MHSRVTLLELDTVRIDVADAVRLFEAEVLPALREEPGYEGTLVLTTPEGKGLVLTLWASEEAAAGGAAFAAGTLERYVALYRSPPGRELYEVAVADLPVRTG